MRPLVMRGGESVEPQTCQKTARLRHPTSGSTLNEYIFLAGRRIARRDSSGNVYYYFSDHLGTSKTITTSAGVVCYDADLLPFGYETAYVTSCSQNYKFTGLERDSETGLDHTLHRKYESRLGRWLSPDPRRGNVGNPQSLNRYTYVLNNPATFTDPLGLADADDDGCDTSSDLAHFRGRPVHGMDSANGDCGDEGGGGGSVGGGDSDSGAGGDADDGDDTVDSDADSNSGDDDVPCYDANNQPIDCSEIGPPYTITVTDSLLMSELDTTDTGQDLSSALLLIPGALAPMANGLLQAVKQAAKGIPEVPKPPVPSPVTTPAPEIELQDSVMARIFNLMSKWLGGGGLGPLPPSTILTPIVNPCLFPSFQRMPMCGGGNLRAMDTQRFEHAIASRDAGRVEEALRELAALTESTPEPEGKATLLANQSTCLIILGRLQEARRQLSLARRVAPRTQIHLYLDFEDAGLCTHEGKWHEALAILDRLQREYGELLLTTDHRELYEQVQIVRGGALRALARFREARTVLEECLRFHLSAKDERHVLYNLGLCYGDLGESERAKQALLEALQKGLQGSDAVSSHYYLGTIYSAEKAYAKALMEFEWCLAHVEEGQIAKKHICEWLASTAQSLGMKGDAERYERLAKG
jgi:RHS repeat-associated protein